MWFEMKKIFIITVQTTRIASYSAGRDSLLIVHVIHIIPFDIDL